ncbi:MAG TPA: PrsW family glutamic-type intramembrane protease, partial [Anaerolineaceae bacterium]|nr:PrsW family glutamic-type intramembrane protease [Anaerolineaceae bacterium]
LLGLNISPGEGYVAGMMSGAGFALLEGMLFAAQTAMTPGGDWVYFLVGRLGGTLIHIFNGALIGWALAKSWQNRKFTRALVIYLLTFIIHGMWNLTVVITQLVPSLMEQEVNQSLTNTVMIILGGLIGLGFIYFGRHVLNSTKLFQVSIAKDANAS